jgi:hypothetical protein
MTAVFIFDILTVVDDEQSVKRPEAALFPAHCSLHPRQKRAACVKQAAQV